jgi:hypothetical protein
MMTKNTEFLDMDTNMKKKIYNNRGVSTKFKKKKNVFEIEVYSEKYISDKNYSKKINEILIEKWPSKKENT